MGYLNGIPLWLIGGTMHFCELGEVEKDNGEVVLVPNGKQNKSQCRICKAWFHELTIIEVVPSIGWCRSCVEAKKICDRRDIIRGDFGICKNTETGQEYVVGWR